MQQHNIDLLIVSPNESYPTHAVEDVFQQGIPVILLDCKIATQLHSTTFPFYKKRK